MSKIKCLDEKRMILESGSVELHVAEASDGIFDLTISEMVDNSLRIGFRDDQGNITYEFWKKIKKRMLRPELSDEIEVGGKEQDVKTKKSKS